MTYASAGFGYTRPVIGFAQYLSKPRKGKTKKSRPNFEPKEAQVLAAVGCIQGCLRKRGVAMTHYTEINRDDYAGDSIGFALACEAATEKAARELVPDIFTRGKRLGSTRHEITITLTAALKRGASDGKFKFVVSDQTGAVGVKLYAGSRKQHKMLNDPRRSDRRRSRRAA
jgi:hypothetical protein